MDNGRDVMMQDIDFSPCGSTIDPPFCTRDLINAAGDPKQNFLNFSRPCSPYNWNSSNVQGVLKDDELLYNNRDSSRRSWQGYFFLSNLIFCHLLNFIGYCATYQKFKRLNAHQDAVLKIL